MVTVGFLFVSCGRSFRPDMLIVERAITRSKLTLKFHKSFRGKKSFLRKISPFRKIQIKKICKIYLTSNLPYYRTVCTVQIDCGLGNKSTFIQNICYSLLQARCNAPCRVKHYGFRKLLQFISLITPCQRSSPFCLHTVQKISWIWNQQYKAYILVYGWRGFKFDNSGIDFFSVGVLRYI